MAGGRPRLSFRSMLALVLALSWGLFATAHEVMPSDNPTDFPSQYRYIMNGSELSIFGISSIGLVPLSASLWSLSPEDFSVRCPTRKSGSELMQGRIQ